MLNNFKVKLLNFVAGNSNKLPKKIGFGRKDQLMSVGCVHTWANGTQAGYIYRLVGIIILGQIFGLVQGQRQRRFLSGIPTQGRKQGPS
jgi:hypothetical protein